MENVSGNEVGNKLLDVRRDLRGVDIGIEAQEMTRDCRNANKSFPIHNGSSPKSNGKITFQRRKIKGMIS